MIVRLGAGRVTGEGCGPKAALLDRAARAGLPVPPGVVVLDEAWHWALGRGLLRLEGPTDRRPVSVPDPSLLMHLLGLPAFTGPLAVRAAFSGEDGATASLPGGYIPGLFVDGQRPPAVAASLAAVWAGALGRPRAFRRDVILQSMVGARAAGVAYTEGDFEDDLVDVTDGGHEPLVSQQVRGWHLLLPKRRGRERATEHEPVAARLQRLLRDVRRVFGEGEWDVEWADDGERIWLVQVAPRARPARRNELFTTTAQCAPWSEPPSRLKSSLTASCASVLAGALRRIDPSFPVGRPLIEMFQARPFVNVSLLSDTVRRWGLPSRIVRDSIGGPRERDTAGDPARMLSHLPTLGRLLRDHLGAARRARRAADQILERTPTPATLPEIGTELQWLYSTLGETTLSLLGAISLPLALLRSAGVLDETTARWRSRSLAFIEEIPLLREQASSPDGSLSLRARLLYPIVWHAERNLEARAHLRSVSHSALERLEKALIAAARAEVKKKRLPSVGSVFELDIDELRELGLDLQPDAHFWSTRAAETTAAAAYQLPDAVRRLDDLESYRA